MSAFESRSAKAAFRASFDETSAFGETEPSLSRKRGSSTFVSKRAWASPGVSVPLAPSWQCRQLRPFVPKVAQFIGEVMIGTSASAAYEVERSLPLPADVRPSRLFGNPN